MDFKFKTLAYQSSAVSSVVECFVGQPFFSGVKYTRDLGKVSKRAVQRDFNEAEDGLKNKEILINSSQLLTNIQSVQRRQNLPQSPELIQNSISKLNLDVEMETGTGKTYCYIKTMFELNKRYGWGKFIIVVPSIAIREGVCESVKLTADHFQQQYGKKANLIVYNSKKLNELDAYSTNSGINIMVINVQAFNAKGKDARRIYDELDEFQSRKPIDVIRSNRPILILDEPQKMEGEKTLTSLIEFNPLMILRYSATHKTTYNKIHRLDALDAYNQKLVKKIAVRGISVRGLSGTNAYFYLENIDISPSKPPVAKIEIEIKYKNEIKRESCLIKKNDNLFDRSNGLNQYKGCVVSEIDAFNGKVSFTNGIILETGDAVGDQNEATLRRLQIREAIRAHFEKESKLFDQGIKVLSLFFIDEVAKYRQYDDVGKLDGEYAKIFEEEYNTQLNSLPLLQETPYNRYLKRFQSNQVHEGYFSIDKKTNKLINPDESRSTKESDDTDAYDLILRNKKRLLSFEEPVRFIFSHSALREGWDNPNVFVICALKHSDNTISRRQEVGRGLRLAVNKNGDRMDNPAIVHTINVLTVVASESYKDFVKGLQEDISKTLAARPKEANEEYFKGKILDTSAGEIEVTQEMAFQIFTYLAANRYINAKKQLTEEFQNAKNSNSLAALPQELAVYTEQILRLIDNLNNDVGIFKIDDDRKPKNKTNSNIDKKEFLELWERINKIGAYTVSFDSLELIDKCVQVLDSELKVSPLQYTITHGEAASFDKIEEGEAFDLIETRTEAPNLSIHSSVEYDLVGKLAEEAKLTRSSVVKILQRISPVTFGWYKINPEGFISQVARIMREQKATTLIQHLTYDVTSKTHNLDMFTKNQGEVIDQVRHVEVKKHILDYVLTDAEKERKFVRELDSSTEVVVYAKLPKGGYTIDTPVGDYTPDWAIAFQEGTVKHVYFVAETKGSMLTLDLRGIEDAKIKCARKFFEKLNSTNIKYGVVDSYSKLMEIVK